MTIGLAVYTLVGFRFRAGTVFYRFSLFDYDYVLFASPADHLKGGKYTGRSGPDDHDVFFHYNRNLLGSQPRTIGIALKTHTVLRAILLYLSF